MQQKKTGGQARDETPPENGRQRGGASLQKRTAKKQNEKMGIIKKKQEGGMRTGQTKLAISACTNGYGKLL